MVEEKYGIKFIEGIRCYKIDLSVRNYNLDFCSPRKFIIDNKVIDENTWIRLLERLFNYLFYKNYITQDELLRFKVDWSNQSVFSKTKENSLYYGPLEKGLYYNGNHTSTHQLWILQDVLSFLGESIINVELYVKLPPIKEEKEVIDYYKEKNLKILKYFLSKRLSFDEDKLIKFIAFFRKVDSTFEKLFKKQISLLLLETKLIYASYKSRFLEQLKNNEIFNKYKKNFLYILDNLTLFYAYVEDNNLLNF